MRLFVAVEMPDVIIREMKRLQNALRDLEICHGTYVGEQGMHLTLKFLGDVSEQQMPGIDSALAGIRAMPIQARVGHVDTFIAGQKITVIYVSLVCPELISLAHKIDQALLPWFAKEARPFVPHLTLMRVKSVHDRERLLHALNKMKVHDTSFEIDSFVLKQSVLTQQGPEYTDVRRYALCCHLHK